MKNLIPSSNAPRPETPTTASNNDNSNKIRHSLASLQKLESNHMGILEGTLQEIKKSERKRNKRNLKSPTDWSINSSIPENAEDLSDLRQELDRAESVYSRRTADATFGDDFSSSTDSEDLMVGSFKPISASFEDDPAAPLTSHVPSPLRINTALQTSTIPSINMLQSPQSQSPVNGFQAQAQNSSSLLSFPQHLMETVSEEKIAAVTPSHKTIKQPEDESTQETSPESNAVPHEVFVPKGSSASTSGIRTVLSTTTFDAEHPPSTPTAEDVRDWATVAEIEHAGYGARPQAVRRHSSFSLMAASPHSFLKSAQSPVHELVKKQERKRLLLKATIDSVRSKNYNVDSRLVQALNEKENLRQEIETQKIVHAQKVTNLENKITFLQRQHELQSEQQEGVHGLTKTHNKFLKEQLDQLQQECERLQKQHKQELAREAEKPKALQEQIQKLQDSKKVLQEKHQRELAAQQQEYEALESKLQKLQEQHRRHVQSLEQELDDEQHKIKKLQDRLVELETVQLVICQQKILVLQDQLETARQEKHDLASQHRAALAKKSEEHAALVQEHAAATKTRDQEIAGLRTQVTDLQSQLQRLESLRAKELQKSHEVQEQLTGSLQQQQQESFARTSFLQANHDKLVADLANVQRERDALVQNQQEQAQLQKQMKTSFLQKVARLEDECTRLQSTLDQGIASQTSEIALLRTKLDLAESEWHDQQATNQELQDLVTQLQLEKEELLVAHSAQLDKAVNANVTLAEKLLKELAFGL